MTLSWARIDSDERGGVKSLFPEEVALGADVVASGDVRITFLQAVIVDGNTRWRYQEPVKGGSAATFGGNGERHGRESS
jgi:hypothetical protein